MQLNSKEALSLLEEAEKTTTIWGGYDILNVLDKQQVLLQINLV